MRFVLTYIVAMYHRIKTLNALILMMILNSVKLPSTYMSNIYGLLLFQVSRSELGKIHQF